MALEPPAPGGLTSDPSPTTPAQTLFTHKAPFTSTRREHVGASFCGHGSVDHGQDSSHGWGQARAPRRTHATPGLGARLAFGDEGCLPV